MSVESGLQRCIADYLREYIMQFGEWESLPEELWAILGIDHVWRLRLAESQTGDMAADIIKVIREYSARISSPVCSEVKK